MKSRTKLFRIIALAAITALSLVSCGDGAGGGGDPALPGSISISVQGGAAAEVGCTLEANYSGGGSETVAYQWNKNGSAIAGKTGLTLLTDAAGSYSVTVSAAGFTSKTSNAKTVNVPDVFTPALLEITINRDDSDGDNFVFKTNSLGANADAYKAFVGGSQVAASATNTVSVPAASLSDRDWTELTAQAFKGAADASLSTGLPGMVKYDDATKLMNTYTDWFKFLDAALTTLSAVNSAAKTPHTTLHNDIKNAISKGWPDSEAMVGEKNYVGWNTDLNNATAAVMDNWSAVYSKLVAEKANPIVQQMLDDIDETTPRLWFNKVLGTGTHTPVSGSSSTVNNDTAVGNILIPAIKTQYPQVNIE